MFIIKNNYYLYIENTENIDLNYLNKNKKISIIYRNNGLYISSFNKKKYLNTNLNLIGSAHSFKEINEKIKQGCKTIFLSRLFKTSYRDKKGHLGLVKFNLFTRKYKMTILPLGGIRESNLNKLRLVNGNGLALLSEIKKKPAITRRLF